MPIDQDFLDGLTDIPKVGEDGVSAPEAGGEAKTVEAGGGGTSGGGPKAEPEKQTEGGNSVSVEKEEEETDPYKLLDALFEEVKPAARAEQKKAEEPKQAEKPTEKKEPPAELKFDSSFLPQSDEDFDKILASRTNFLEFQNKFLASMHSFYEAKIQGVLSQMPAFQQRAVEEAMQRAAQFVPVQVQEQLTLQKMVDQFYVDNANLVPIRRLVGQVANKVQAAHPDWGYDKIFDETAKHANKLAQALNLPQVEKANGATTKKPAFAKVPGGGRKPAVEKTSLQKDIDLLIS